ncbi:MAG: hypothetical protein RL392_1433 [Pseudomonadota bacterium]|jgi:glycosyltransferase involved in cell wall biosynthesis
MRVLALTHSLGTNGAALCLCRLLVAIKATGGAADVLYSGNEPLAAYLQDSGVGVVDDANTANYDVAVVNTLIDHQRVAQLAPALPVVFWVHEGASSRDNGLAYASQWLQAFALSSRVVFNTPWQVDTVFKSFLGLVDPHRISCVDPAATISAAFREQRYHHANKRNVVSVGSVYPRKRPADLVSATLYLSDASAHCTLVGNTDHLQANGDAMLQALDAHPHLFTLAGTVTDAHKLDLMRAADVFCSASEDETFGIAPLEAACLGLPVALSDLPCYAGIWKHGVNALLSPVGAIDVLAWNLKALMQDTGLADRLARAGYATAQRFTHERFLRGMSSVLVDAIEDRLPLFTAP